LRFIARLQGYETPEDFIIELVSERLKTDFEKARAAFKKEQAPGQVRTPDS
jgi:hypothetical protein